MDTSATTTPLDPVLQAVLDDMQARRVPSLFAIPIEQARERVHLAALAARQRCAPPAVFSVHDS